MRYFPYLHQWAPYISGVRTWLLKVKPKMAEIDVQCQSLSIVLVCAVSTNWHPVPVLSYCSSCFDVDLKKNTGVFRGVGTGGGGTSMSAIFGFTSHMGRMTEVLTPDIYRAHWPSLVKISITWSFPANNFVFKMATFVRAANQFLSFLKEKDNMFLSQKWTYDRKTLKWCTGILWVQIIWCNSLK